MPGERHEEAGACTFSPSGSVQRRAVCVLGLDRAVRWIHGNSEDNARLGKHRAQARRWKAAARRIDSSLSFHRSKGSGKVKFIRQCPDQKASL